MEFDWDDAKAESNYAKHGIEFDYATRVFSDPDRITEIDERRDYGEIRENTTGAVNGVVIITVTHTDRSGVTRLEKRVAKKGSNTMGKIIKMTLAEAMAKPISARQQAALDRLNNMRDEDIDFSDNPEVTDDDYAAGRVRIVARGGKRIGAGRKPSGTKQVSLWLHESTIAKMTAFAKREKSTLSATLEKHLVWK